MNITLEAKLAKLPIGKVEETIRKHIHPMVKKLPDKRMAKVIEIMVMGILGGQTPVITGIARQNSKEDGESWATAKRIYRLLENKHLKTGDV